MTDEEGLDFNGWRRRFLEGFANQGGVSLLSVVREYNSNAEFKRRIDIAVLEQLAPVHSEAIH